MKKALMTSFLLFITLIMLSCNAYNQKYTRDESIEKFEFTELQLHEICEKYEVELSSRDVNFNDLEECDNNCFYEWAYTIDGLVTGPIFVTLSNTNGEERFSIFSWNEIDNLEQAGTAWDVDILYELINIASTHIFSIEFIYGFLTGPESDYSPPWDKDEQLLIEKCWSSEEIAYGWGSYYYLGAQLDINGKYSEYFSFGGSMR